MFSTDSASFWNDMYLNDQAGWDMRSPTPVFEDLLNDQQFIKSGKMLIAGCGMGYDAVLAAQKGLDVYAVDFAPEAIKSAKLMAEKEKIKMNLIHEDIFKLDSVYKDQFDYVYDYVTYCAIDPSRRKEYAEKTASLLKPGGKLIALLFPVEDRPGGPPYAVDIIEFYEIFSKHLHLTLSSKKINTIKPRRGREVLQIYIKKEQQADADKS